MSYTPPYPTFLANLASTHYGLVHLALANTAYTYEAFPLAIASQFASFIPTLPQISDITGQTGYWSLDWGPAFCTATGGLFNDNLVAIVSYRLGSLTGAPAFFAVMCRGTDVGGGIAQISEDFDAFTQQPWSYVLDGAWTYGGATLGTTIQPKITQPPANSGSIATGSANALIAVTNLVPYETIVNQGTPTYLGSSLMSLLETYPGTPVVVTGHSLGGALTQVVAAYLSSLIKQTGDSVGSSQVFAHPFAPPTVGDPTFATYYNTILGSSSQYWVNNFDLVPTGFANLDDAKVLWGQYKWQSATGFAADGPTIFGIGENVVKHAVLQDEQNEVVKIVQGKLPAYARPTNVQAMSPNTTSNLPSQDVMTTFVTDLGGNPANWNTWGVQLEYQHFMVSYYPLVKAVNGVLDYPSITLPAPPNTF